MSLKNFKLKKIYIIIISGKAISSTDRCISLPIPPWTIFKTLIVIFVAIVEASLAAFEALGLAIQLVILKILQWYF